jgi:hypothetical protein
MISKSSPRAFGNTFKESFQDIGRAVNSGFDNFAMARAAAKEGMAFSSFPRSSALPSEEAGPASLH